MVWCIKEENGMQWCIIRNTPCYARCLGGLGNNFFFHLSSFQVCFDYSCI
ncbi:hypothetical protein HanRHA438_Chr06g0254511 [Helianthus annuus]|nr:hypothetical protein HanRHA438_Chr06g0254511 [Helianthus annuus]